MTTIAICGSATFLNEMVGLQKQLEAVGFEVRTPMENGMESADEGGYSEEAVRLKMHSDAIRNYHRIISGSDGVLIANYSKNGVENYIVLVQQKYHWKFKDPYSYFTGHKVSRERLMRYAVVNTLALF